ncbi:hypothetical protein NEOLEDRAFT_1182767 [Neolentinus lepideus HHB14362 ss-1]|uniref:Uncharacterized protein n=1 Tax=Neolentinus lepideus HHB14362 ss-1 TaxID=1314782 RepID=A0A165NUI3_9AGAM|nr:hypothetical protein NEOLEDRAFT_1182767 [Neolentinus lepideus HHB14362 ss-1]
MTQDPSTSSFGGRDRVELLQKHKKPYSSEYLARLAQLSRGQLSEFNKQIEARNTYRAGKDERRKTDTSVSPSSSVESLVDIVSVEDEGPPHCSTPKNGNKFQVALQMLASLSPSVFDKVVGFVSSKRKADDVVPEDTPEGKKQKLLTTDEEIKIAPGATVRYQGVHPEIKLLILHKQYLMLILFMNEGLKMLAEQGDMMPWKKLASKVSIIDVSKFKDESTLDESGFRQGVDSTMAVFSELGDGAYVKCFDDHWTWFFNLPDFTENFDAALETDIELRQEYQIKPFEFDPVHYNTCCRVKVADIQIRCMAQLERELHSSFASRPSGQGAGPSRGPAPPTNGRRGGGTGGTGGQRFQGGNGGASPAPVCLICS